MCNQIFLLLTILISITELDYKSYILKIIKSLFFLNFGLIISRKSEAWKESL